MEHCSILPPVLPTLPGLPALPTLPSVLTHPRRQEAQNGHNALTSLLALSEPPTRLTPPSPAPESAPPPPTQEEPSVAAAIKDIKKAIQSAKTLHPTPGCPAPPDPWLPRGARVIDAPLPAPPTSCPPTPPSPACSTPPPPPPLELQVELDFLHSFIFFCHSDNPPKLGGKEKLRLFSKKHVSSKSNLWATRNKQ